MERPTTTLVDAEGGFFTTKFATGLWPTPVDETWGAELGVFGIIGNDEKFP
jgi:hypothetical protein